MRGLEEVVTAEIETRLRGRNKEIGHRDLVFDADHPARAVRLRTVDDVYLLAGRAEGVGRTKADLRRLGSRVEELPIPWIASVRDGAMEARGRATGVAVTGSFLGRRNFTRFDLEDEIGRRLERTLGLPYQSRRDGPPPTTHHQFRVHLADDRALLGLRLSENPLHRRAYKTFAPSGTTHPPVAAALVALSLPASGSVLWDPTCGAGTIPIEANPRDPELRTVGSDTIRGLLRGAAANAARAAASTRFLQADANALPIGDEEVDTVIANLPWGRQARWLTGSATHQLFEEIGRVLRTDGTAVLLTESLDLGDTLTAGLRPLTESRISMMGAHPTITVLKKD